MSCCQKSNDQDGVELSIVIVVDGEEKQCSGSGTSTGCNKPCCSRPSTPTGCQKSCCSRPATPTGCNKPCCSGGGGGTPQQSRCCSRGSNSAHSCCSGGGSGNNNKVVIPISVGKPVCQSAPSSCQSGGCQQNRCQSGGCQQNRCQSGGCQHNACQSGGGCQQRQCQSQHSFNPPRIIPTGNCCCASLMNTCPHAAAAMASSSLPCKSKSQTTSCQTVGGVRCAAAGSQTRACTRSCASTTQMRQKQPCAKKKPCSTCPKSVESRVEAKAGICQTQPEVRPRSRRTDDEKSEESSRTSRRKERPRERRARERSERRRERERSEEKDELPPSGPVRKPRKSSLIPPDQINFSQPSPVQMTFVDFFLQNDGCVTRVIKLAEAKRKYEKKCKSTLSKLAEDERQKAEKFFMKIVESIQVKFPEGNTTDVKAYQITKYASPVMQDLGISADRDLRQLQKYHTYVVGVIGVIEQRMRSRDSLNVDAVIDVEAALLAGFLSRCYPLFIKMKDVLAVLCSKSGSQDPPPEEFVRQLRKLILAIYVEILSIDVFFTNALSSLGNLDKYRQSLVQRRGHARHSVTWAGRCIATVLLYYFLQSKAT